MKMCPFVKCKKDELPYCYENECALADECGKCLIKQSLSLYIQKREDEIREEIKIREETIQADWYNALCNNLIKLSSSHKLEYCDDEKEDNDKVELKLKPPKIDGSYIHF